MRKYFSAALCACLAFLQATSASLASSTSAADDAAPKAAGLTKTENHPRVALALGGGGTRGAAHIGVLRVLDREKIPIDMIVGTSMGAIIGGFYCAGISPDQIQARIEDKRFLNSFNTVPIPVRVALIPIMLLPHMFGYHPYDGLYRGNRFAKYINKCVPERDREIQDMKPMFAGVATNLLDSKPYAITCGNLGKVLQASSAIPFLRKPVFIDGKLFVDGGISANLPVKQARDLGADIVIAVDVDEGFAPPLAADHFRKVGSVPPRVISMLLAKIDEDQLLAADIVIHPDVTGITLLEHHKEVGLQAVEAGEKAAEKALPLIKSKLGIGQSAAAPAIKAPI